MAVGFMINTSEFDPARVFAREGSGARGRDVVRSAAATRDASACPTARKEMYAGRTSAGCATYPEIRQAIARAVQIMTER